MDNGLISVKYIGKRPECTDGLYGTRIHWFRGDSRMVPADKARQMLKHTDVYAPGKKDAPVPELPKVPTEEESTQDMRDTVANMDVESLAVYAKTSFQVKLDKRKSLQDLRTQVTSLVDQFGAL